VNSAILYLSFFSSIACSIILSLRSRNFGKLLHDILSNHKSFWLSNVASNYIRRNALLILAVVCNISGIAYVMFSYLNDPTLPLWLKLVLVFAEVIFITGSLAVVPVFRYVCHALSGALQTRYRKFINNFIEKAQSKRFIEDFEAFLHKVRRKKHVFLLNGIINSKYLESFQLLGKVR
jgi:hypothetical protein